MACLGVNLIPFVNLWAVLQLAHTASSVHTNKALTEKHWQQCLALN